MRDLRSVWRKQIELVINAPHRARVRNGKWRCGGMGLIRRVKRIMP